MIEAVVMLLLGTLIGGYLGTRLIKRLKPMTVRILICCIGIGTAINLLLR